MKHPYVDLHLCAVALAEQKKKNGQIASAINAEKSHENELKKYNDPNSIYYKAMRKIMKEMKALMLLPTPYTLNNGFVGEYC